MRLSNMLPAVAFTIMTANGLSIPRIYRADDGIADRTAPEDRLGWRQEDKTDGALMQSSGEDTKVALSSPKPETDNSKLGESDNPGNFATFGVVAANSFEPAERLAPPLRTHATLDLPRPSTDSVSEIITNKLKTGAASLIDILITTIVIPATLYGAIKLQELGLLGSLVVAAAIFGQIQADPRTSWILECTVGASYMILHVAYCALRTASLRYGEGYIATTIILTGIAAIFLLQIPALATTWNKCSGMVNIGVLLVLHLVAVFLTSAGVKVWRRFWRSRQKTDDDMNHTITT